MGQDQTKPVSAAASTLDPSTPPDQTNTNTSICATQPPSASTQPSQQQPANASPQVLIPRQETSTQTHPSTSRPSQPNSPSHSTAPNSPPTPSPTPSEQKQARKDKRTRHRANKQASKRTKAETLGGGKEKAKMTPKQKI